LSPTDSGKDLNATPSKTEDGHVGVPSDNSVVHDEAQHSLFMDTIDPRFRPKLPDAEESPPFLTPRSPQLDPTTGPASHAVPDLLDPQDRPSTRLPESIFKDSHEKKPDLYDPSSRPPNESTYIFPQPGIFDYRSRNPYSERSQHFGDDAADNVFPGFGRFEGAGTSQDWRLDYLSGRSCRLKGLGLCFKMNFH
jgi:hypothetical protein